MPITLTSPYAPGGSYVEAHITSFSLDPIGREVKLSVIYGNTVNGVVVPSDDNARSFTISGPAYDTLIAIQAAGNITIYDAAAKELYQWLKDNHLEYDGNIT